MKAIFRYAFFTVTFFVFFCGMYRHDVDKQQYLDLAMQPQFDCVGRVYLDGKSKGTGELIDKKHFLSAAHVFTERYGTEKPDGSYNLRIPEAGRYTIDLKGRKYTVKKILIYPDYRTITGGFDIALMELTEEVQGIAPAILYTGTGELHTIVTCVGYGASGPATELNNYAKGAKIAGENVIDSIGGPLINGHLSTLTFDFDSPDDTTLNVMGSPIPLPLEYLPNGGDSGGGMFINENGKWTLAGITSWTHNTMRIQSGYYGSTTNYVRVSAYADWIKNSINE